MVPARRVGCKVGCDTRVHEDEFAFDSVDDVVTSRVRGRFLWLPHGSSAATNLSSS
jgi:hypothetical protein